MSAITESTSRDPDLPLISLHFDLGQCLHCGESGIPGDCECGGKILASRADGGVVRARACALRPFLESSQEILESYESHETGEIDIDIQQFVSSVGTLGWFGRARSVLARIESLSQLDLNDKKSIGGPVRRRCARLEKDLKSMSTASEELRRFRLSATEAEMQAAAISIGQHLTKVAVELFKALTSVDFVAAEKHGREFEKLLKSTSAVESFGEQLANLEQSSEISVSRRLSRLSATQGEFESSNGFIDIDALLGTFSDTEDPIGELEKRLSQFLSTVIGEKFQVGPSIVLLASGAAAISALDDPFPAHRAMREIFRISNAALDADTDATTERVKLLVDHANIILGSRARLERRFKSLAERGDDELECSKEEIAEFYLESLHDVTESTWRRQGHLLRDLIAISRFESIPAETNLPMTANLAEQLDSACDPFATEFSADAKARNSFAHKTYDWDPVTDEMFDVETGVRWHVDDLGESFALLNALVLGFDAGLTAALLNRDISIHEAPETNRPRATKLVLSTMLGLNGFSVRSVDPAGTVVVVEQFTSADVERLLPPVLGYSKLIQGCVDIRVSCESEPKLEVVFPVEKLNSWAESGDPERQLFLVRANMETRRVSGLTLNSQARNVGPVCLKIALIAADDLLQESTSRATISRCRSLFSSATEIIREYGEGEVTNQAIARLSRCGQRSADLYLGRRGSVRELSRAMDSALAWVSQLDFEWP